MKTEIAAVALTLSAGFVCAGTAFRAADAIVVTNEATPKTQQGRNWYRAAVIDLTNALTHVTGARIAVYEEGREPKNAKAVIYFGETKAAKVAGIADKGLRNADWRVKTVPGKAYLFGTTGTAASYAMTEFAERLLDCHFLTPHSGLTCTPNPNLVVPIVDIVRKPVIYWRLFSHHMFDGNKYPTLKKNWEDWYRRRRCESDEYEGEYLHCSAAAPGNCHAIYNYLPPEKYFKDHPEWYSMTPQGKRRAVYNAKSQICYTNPEAREMAYRHLVKFVEDEYARHPDHPRLVFDMSQMDNGDFLCLCPECKKAIAKYNRVPGGHEEGGDAGLQLEFINDLARRIRVKYPRVQLRVFAYVSTERAPKPGTIVPEPNVVIWWADLYTKSCHLYPLETSGHFNHRQVEEIGEWSKLTRNILVYDYVLCRLPDVIPDAAAADAKFYSRLGLPAIYNQCNYYEQPFYFLNFYLQSALYVDPTQDVEALVHRFCRVYGKGAAEMEAAIRHMRRIQNATKVDNARDWHLRNLSWLTVENYERLVALCESAYKKDKDPNVRAQILPVLKDAWTALLGMYKKDPAATDKFARAMERCRRFGKEWARYGFVEPGDRAARAAEVDDELDVLTLRFDDLPAAFNGVPDKEVYCYDYHSFYHWLRKENDPAAFRGRALIVPPDRDFGTGFPFVCGISDDKSKELFQFKLTAADLPPDGKYHWVKLGRIYLGRATRIWFPAAGYRDFPLSANHIYADGLAVDPNWYEAWASFCVDGPVFVSGSSAQNTIRLDRVALRRIAPPEEK